VGVTGVYHSPGIVDRRFVRGKRAGKAPIELLTGKELEQTWLESLLETV
jgi:hypothetical protein